MGVGGHGHGVAVCGERVPCGLVGVGGGVVQKVAVKVNAPLDFQKGGRVAVVADCLPFRCGLALGVDTLVKGAIGDSLRQVQKGGGVVTTGGVCRFKRALEGFKGGQGGGGGAVGCGGCLAAGVGVGVHVHCLHFCRVDF